MLDETGDLEPAAALAGRLLRLLDDPDVGPNQVAREASADQALTTTILRAANSAFYARAGGQVKDVTEALVVLGFDTARQIVMGRLSRGALRREGDVERTLWDHALATALGAQACARQARGVTVGYAFTAGLLHDVGKTALLRAFPDQCGAIWKAAATVERPTDEAERDRFGTDHAEVGAALLERWRLPAAYGAVARRHHDPAALSAVGEKDRRLCAMVILADAVATWSGHGFAPARPMAEMEGHPMLEPLGQSRMLLDAMARHAAEQLEALRGIFR